MKCPKCSTIQADSNCTCTRCGISLEKIKAKRAASAATPLNKSKLAPKAAKPPASTSQSTLVWYGVLCILFYSAYLVSQAILGDEKPAAMAEARPALEKAAPASAAKDKVDSDMGFVKCCADAKRKGLIETEAVMRCSSLDEE